VNGKRSLAVDVDFQFSNPFRCLFLSEYSTRFLSLFYLFAERSFAY